MVEQNTDRPTRRDHRRTVKDTILPMDKDIHLEMERMSDEGGGVVIDHSFPLGEPILRNDLVRTNKPSVDGFDPGQFES